MATSAAQLDMIIRAVGDRLPIDMLRAYIPKKYWTKRLVPFTYTMEFNTLTAGATLTDDFTVAQDCGFLVCDLSFIEATAAAGTSEQTYAPILARISENASGGPWTDQQTHIENLFGRLGVQGTGPRKMYVPRWLDGNATVTAELQNLEASARRVWLAYHGVKVLLNQAAD